MKTRSYFCASLFLLLASCSSGPPTLRLTVEGCAASIDSLRLTFTFEARPGEVGTATEKGPFSFPAIINVKLEVPGAATGRGTVVVEGLDPSGQVVSTSLPTQVSISSTTGYVPNQTVVLGGDCNDASISADALVDAGANAAGVFFYTMQNGSAPLTTQVVLARTDGTEAHFVTCPRPLPFAEDAGTALQPQEFVPLSMYQQSTLQRAYYDSNLRGHFAYSDQTGAATFALLLIDEDGDCAKKAPQVLSSGEKRILPRFAPDGKRLSFIDGRLEHLFTTDASESNAGQDRRTLASRPAMWPVPPVYYTAADSTQRVIFVEDLNGQTDPKHLTPKLALSSIRDLTCVDMCPEATLLCNFDTAFKNIHQVEVLDSGDKLLIAAGKTSLTSPAGGPVDLYLVTLSTACPGGVFNLAMAQNLTNGANGTMSRDFTLSPDKKNLVFSSTLQQKLDGGIQATQRDLFILKGDGTGTFAAPALLVSDSTGDDVGPQFIGNNVLVWTRVGRSTAGDAVFSATLEADGTAVAKQIYPTGAMPKSSRLITGVNDGNGCSFSPHAAAGASLFFALATLGLAAFVVSRQRSNS